MGLSGMGLAVPFGSGSLRALCPRAGQTTQESHRVGLADALVGKTLVARARDRGRSRRRVCFLEAPGPLPASGRPITFITRLRLDAALYEPAPPRKPGQMGRPRLKGERLANLSAVAEDPKTAWTPITMSSWYGGAQRTVEIVSETAIWYSTGFPAVPFRWVLIRDPEGEFETQALLCTDLSADPDRIISWFVETLADGVHLSRGASAPGLRDPAAMVGDGDPEDRPGAVEAVLRGHALRAPADG